MSPKLVNTGIDVIGPVPWGTHFCQFYQTKADLLDTLVPYFKAGLENNEFCMWITAGPLSAQEARQAMRLAVPDFTDRLAKSQIEILPHTDWYLKGGSFDQQRVLDGWVDKLNGALAAGYAGLRLTGNTFWLEKQDWKSFTDYEAAINDVIGRYHMLALCTYSLDKCGAAEVMDVIRNHELALVRKEGKWELVENAVYKQARQTLMESERKYRQLMESLQEGVWVIDTDAYTTFVNPRMAEMLGYSVDEMLGKQLFSFIDESNLSLARERMERRRRGIKEEVEFLFRRKDGQPLWALISAAPLTDVKGNFSGVIAGIVDVTERKQMEERLAYLASFPEQNPMFVIETDELGNVSYANPAIRRHFPDLVTVGSKHPYLAGIPELMQSGQRLEDKHTIREIKIGQQYYQQVISGAPQNQHVRIYGTDVTELKQAEAALRRIEWLLTRQAAPQEQHDKRLKGSAQSYGDLTHLNCSRLILDSVGQDILADIVGDYLDLLSTSAAVYEKNGDYALGIFTSGWCQFMDIASRNLCGTADNQEALSCGKWLCHESCWTKASKAAIESGQPMDIECEGGIHLYAAPIRAGGEIVGSINFGYGDPPRDPVKQRELAAKYHVSVAELDRQAKAYETRPLYVIELAKQRLQASARLIGEIVDRKKAEEGIRRAKEEWERTFDSVPDLIAVLDDQHRIVRVNKAMAARLACTPEQCVGLHCYKAVHGTDAPPAFCPHAKTLTDQCEHIEEIREDRLGGVFLVSTNPILDSQGRTIGSVHVARDITERKLVEMALRESGDRMARAQEIAHLGSWELDLVNNRLTWSDEAYRIFGLQPQEFSATYEAFLEAVHPDDRAAVDAAYSGSIREGRDTYDIEHRIVRRSDDQVHIVYEKCQHFRDASGRVTRSVGMVHDITDRRQAEERLRSSEVRYRRLFETAQDGILILDGKSGKIADVNAFLMQMLGYSHQDLVGKTLWEISPFKDIPLNREAFRKLRKKGYARYEHLPLESKDGRRIDVEFVSNVYPVNGEKVIQCNIRDITERRKAEESLRETRDYLDNLLNHASAPIVVWDTDIRIVRFNRAFQRLTGLSEDEVLGRQLSLAIPRGNSGGIAETDSSDPVPERDGKLQRYRFFG